jgi:hypothetical protein
MVKKVAVGRGRRREKRRESTRSDQTAGMAERAAAPFSICLSDPQERYEAVVQEGAQNGVKKVNPFWGSSIESERACEPRGAHPLLIRRSQRGGSVKAAPTPPELNSI